MKILLSSIFLLCVVTSVQAQYGSNLLTNPGAETSDFTGWTVTNGGSGWAVENSGAHSGTYCFASSYEWGSLEQEVNLITAGYTAAALDAQPPIYAGVWVMSRDDHEARYEVIVDIRDSSHVSLMTWSSGEVALPIDSPWTSVGIGISGYGAGARYVYIELRGDDGESNWAGQYGARFDDAEVRVKDQSPVVRTGVAQDVLDTSAVLVGTVKPLGLTTAWQFEYGATSSYGSTTAGDSINDPGNALCLDSSAGAYATVPDGAQLELVHGFTIEAWFRHDSLTPSGQVARILSKVVAGGDGGYSLGIDEYGKIWYTSFGKRDYVTTNSYIDTGVWYHVAVILDANDNAKFYVNGNYKETSPGGWGPARTNTDMMYMGFFPQGSDGWYFKGLIDEICIWNTMLADSTIRNWMGKTVTASHPDYSHLVGYWCFNETSGTTAHDQSSYGNNGTLHNATFVSGARDIPVYQNVTGLSASSLYHFRLDASNGGGSAHGADSTFMTLSTLPIQLASLTATTTAIDVKLEWTTISETNNLGFYVERKPQSGGTFATVSGLIHGANTSLEEHHYSWIDSTVTAGSYVYRLRQVDLNGATSYSRQVLVSVVLGVNNDPAPRKFQLLQSYPNPFNPSATIKFSVEHAEHATLIVYDVLGQEVARLFDGAAEPGHYYRLTFDGSRVGSGMYIYRIVTESHTDVKKMLMLK